MNKLYFSILILFMATLSSYCQNDKFVQGQRIYEVNCGNCHMADGKGMGKMFPDITQSAYLTAQKSELVCLIVNGKEGQVMETVNMPGNKEITPVGINNLINYLNHTWGDKSLSNLNEVKAQFENCNE